MGGGEFEFYPLIQLNIIFIHNPSPAMEFYQLIETKIEFHSFIRKECYPLRILLYGDIELTVGVTQGIACLMVHLHLSGRSDNDGMTQ